MGVGYKRKKEATRWGGKGRNGEVREGRVIEVLGKGVGGGWGGRGKITTSILNLYKKSTSNLNEQVR